MKTVILTEKPSVARDFADCLGADNKYDYFENNEYIITWAIGHLLTPFDPDDYDQNLKKWKIESLPIIPSKFQYKPVTKTKKRLLSIVKVLNRDDVDKIIVATDAGREGELIARCILTYAKVKKESFRFWTSEALTAEVIRKNLDNLEPLQSYDRIYAAGMARQMADWIVGMNFSRLATLKMGDLFSVGRVQTAVLALFHKREMQINKFISQDYFHLNGLFEFFDQKITAIYIDSSKKELRSRILKIENVEVIKKRCLGQKAIVNKCLKTLKIIKSPLLYSLTEIQKEANRRYEFSAKKTLDIAQLLYEKYKCLSYPRSDAMVLGTGSLDLASNIKDNLCKIFPSYFKNFDPKKMSLNNKRIFNDAALTDHHGLIPLKEFTGNKNSDEAKIYDLIVRRFASSFSYDHKFEDTSLHINIGTDIFFAKGKKITEQGFKINEFLEQDILLPHLEVGDCGKIISFKDKQLQTLPPSHYSDATILQDMVSPSRLVDDKDQKKIFATEIGLGTQSTRAAILETLLNRKYIIRHGRYLKIQVKGSFLIENFEKMKLSSDLAKPSQTASWELLLDRISKGEKIGREFIESIILFTRQSIGEWNKSQIETLSEEYRTSKNTKSGITIGVCPLCKSAIYENSKAYGHENYGTSCSFVIWKKISGRTISKTQAKKILTHGKTDLIKGFKSKAGRPYNAMLSLIDNQVKLVFEKNDH